MAQSYSLDQLKRRHIALEGQITEETRRPMPDDMRILALKKEKLAVREEIETQSH